MIIKLTTRKPDKSEEKPRNMNPANPKAIEISDCTQNELLTVQVSISLNVRTNDVPADPAESNMYAKTYIQKS